jgi:hypothetical protein
MRLVAECLDKQLRDRRGRAMGRVDGVVLALRAGARPHVAAIEVGAVTRARRLSARLGRWMAARARRRAGDEDPYRIPFERVVVERIEARVGIDADDTPVLAWERRLRALVMRIPGA